MSITITDNKDCNMWLNTITEQKEQLTEDLSRRNDELSKALDHIHELKEQLQSTRSELIRTKATLADTVARAQALEQRIDHWNVPEYSQIGVAPPARSPLPGQLRM